MPGLLSRIFASPSVVTDMGRTVGGIIDNLNFSDEEKAEAKIKLLDGVAAWMASTRGQNLARRFIAIVVTVTWSAHHWAGMIVDIARIWTEVDTAVRLAETSASIRTGGDAIQPAMLLILGFYFAAPHIGTIADAALKKFAEGKPRTAA